MGGVYCPTCEAGVEVTATFCLSCGHDLSRQGPITATGHDLNQLKDVIRLRDDLSMAEKFDMIAQVEDGADPIALGIAAAGDDDDGQTSSQAPLGETVVAPELREAQWGNTAADVAVDMVLEGTPLSEFKQSGSLNSDDERITKAMDLGRQATLRLLEVAQGAVLPAHDALQSIPIMQPPTKSFCPKCGSDIHANAMLQWTKWTSMSNQGLVYQLEAAMKASLMHLAAGYQQEIQSLNEQLTDIKNRPSSNTGASTSNTSASKGADKTTGTQAPSASPKSTDEEPATQTKSEASPKTNDEPAKAKPKSGGLFGAKKAKKTYEGEPEGKAEWFLNEALDTVYDPHGTGKAIKGAQILARSADGNVRVRDVVRTYAEEGEAGISELAWTSPLTKYIIEAYDAC